MMKPKAMPNVDKTGINRKRSAHQVDPQSKEPMVKSSGVLDSNRRIHQNPKNTAG